MAEHVGADHAAIHRMDALVEGTRIGDHANERARSDGVNTRRKTIKVWQEAALEIKLIGSQRRHQVGLV